MNRHLSLDFSVDALMAEARGKTGIDIVDHDVVEPLAVLHKSYNQDAVLNERSAPFLKNFLLRLLCNRLRMQRDFAAHPEIADQKVDAPIIICGMARTGSTKLQKLLAASGDFNWLPYWQSLNPCLYTGSRDESPQPRIEDTEDFVAYMNEVSPNIRLGHEYNAHEPEEEYFLMTWHRFSRDFPPHGVHRSRRIGLEVPVAQIRRLIGSFGGIHFARSISLQLSAWTN